MSDNCNYTDEENRALDLKKRKFRRNAALVSFVLCLVICVYYVIIGLFVEKETAETMAQFNSIIITLLGVFMSIILGHLGFDHFEKR